MEEDVHHIIDHRNIMKVMLTKKEIQNFQNLIYKQRDNKIQKLIKREEEEEEY